MRKKITDWLKVLLLLLVVALLVFGFFERRAIIDWIKLARYTPPAAIEQIADDDTMTAYGRHLFYVNYPKLEDKQTFTADCPNNSEKTIILGCYKSGDAGIYLLQVNDPRLDGVEQVTAAHEMLHAAYARLSTSEKNKVDKWLNSYFKTVHDQELIDTINDYKKSEPGAVDDEMHSVFGSQVANLPPNLENYYKKYFNDRSAVTDYAAKYSSTFIKLKQQIATYDQQLKQLKSEISANRSTLSQQNARLEDQRQQLERAAANGDAETYSSEVGSFNAAVRRYNDLARQTQDEISQYNQIIVLRNRLAISINSLGRELDANVQTVEPAD